MRVAVFTMVYNESLFLPAWISYYSKHFGREHLYIIDVGSTDGSTDGIGANCLKVPRSLLEEEKRTRFVHHFHASMLSYYDVVIFTDTDEFLVADPIRYEDLRQFLTVVEDSIVAGVGLNVIHQYHEEAPLYARMHLFQQRNFVQFDSLYCKPLIGRVPIDWTPGFHSCKGQFSLRTDLYLFHLKAFDRGIFLTELRIKRQAGLSQDAINKGHGVQLHMADDELMKLYFPFFVNVSTPIVSDSFDFSSDLQRYVQIGFQEIHSSRGTIAKIPERFRDTLPSF